MSHIPNAEERAAGIPIAKFVYGRWSRDGIECGLRLDVPLKPTPNDLADAREGIARHALFLDEHRRAEADRKRGR